MLNNKMYFSNYNSVFSDQSIIAEIEKYNNEKEKIELNNRILELEKENVTLQNENTKLKELVAQLSKNSKNSSKPPSSDIVKGSKKDKNTPKKKQGAQPGHKKHERLKFSEEEIDNFFEYTLDKCPDCSSELEICKEKTKIIQQIEIIKIPVKIDEHKGYAYWCENCKKVHYAHIPHDIVKAGLCGSSVTALVGYMKSALHSSFSTIRKFLRDIVKVKISRGQLVKLVNKVGTALDVPYTELLDKIPFERKINVDETGHKDNGNKFWTWCFRADLYILFKINKSRGSKVLIEVLGKEFDGLLGCDFFSAYRKYIKDFNITVQFCIAHLIREIRFLTESSDIETKEYGNKLLDLIRELFKTFRDYDGTNSEYIKNELTIIKNKILDVGINEAPSLLDENGKETKRKAQSIARRFKLYGESYFIFITNPEIDPTNNIAEQAIRFVVIDRHITQGTRSENGRKNCERLWTVIATCSLQGRSAYEFIKQAVEAFFKNTLSPSLLPGMT